MLTFDRALANPLRASVMYPPDRRLFRPFAVAARVADLLAAVGPRAGLYAHVPFCETKCTYCDYETVPLGKYAGAGVEAYVQALCTELRTTLAALPRATTITGFDIGGGTPGAMSAEQFLRVIDTLGAARRAAGFEISTETTPTLAAADPPKWAAIRRAGVSRVSMGVQTDDEALLGRMNRAQDKSDRMRRGIDALRDAGFAIVNLDLMFALPGLTAERFIESVDFAIALAPDVITIYDTVYKNRGIATQARRWDLTPAPKDYGDQYDRAFLRLNAAGYRGRYGSVNFSRVPGRLGTSRYLESRILDGADYVGVGLYASSLAGKVWRFGKKSYGAWIERAARGDLAAEDVYALPKAHVMAKYLLLALSYGYVDGARFQARFAERFSDRFARALSFAIDRGLLQQHGDDYTLVPGAFADLPGLRALFYPDDALPWLEVPL